jgi:hypothetical protein
MKLSNALSTLRVVIVAFGMIVAFGIPTFGQEAPLQKEASAPQPAPVMNEVLRHNIEDWVLQGRGVPEDWSHHHLVFSNPGTEEDAIANGTHDRWLSIVNDPRYIIQQLKRRAAQGPAAADIASIESIAATQDPTPAAKSKKKSKLKKDWSEPLGSGAAATLTGVVGTLSSSTISGSSTLTVDGVTFDASAPVAAAGSVQVNCGVGNCGTYTVTIGSTIYSIATSLPSGSSPANAVLDGGNNTAGRLNTTKNLRAAMLNNSAVCGSTAPCFKNVSAANATVTPGAAANPLTLTATTAGTGGNSIVLSDTGCTVNSPFPDCFFGIVTEMSLNSTSTTATITTTTLGATSGGQDGTPGTDGTTSGTSTPPTFAYWSVSTYLSSASVATNIAAAVNANTTVSAVITATPNSPASGDVTFTAKSVGPGGNSYSVAEASFSAFTGTGSLSGGQIATVQPNMYPATYVASLTGASCSDFAVYPTGQAGSSTAANIIAYDNLYATGAGAPCSGGPSVLWAYNTGAYAVTTSPILSVDGKQIAFIESNGTTASLVLIKWASETGESVTAPLTLTNSGTPAAYQSCTPTTIAPCMFTIAFANGQNDTLSAPFYDFAGSDDVLYVGDDSGNLHKFTGVFAGKPGESGNPWTNLGTNKLSSPVYDSNSGHIFVGDMGGTLYSVTSTGSRFGTAALGDAIADAPMVDGSAGSLYAFVTTSTNPAVFNGDNVVFQFSTGFTSLSLPRAPGVVAVGTGGAGLGYYLYAGDFDNVYYESSSPTAGSLYVVGNTGATTGGILYRITISGGGMTGSTAGPTVTAAAHPWPSPATEFCNNGTSACAVTTGGCTGGVTCTTSGKDFLFFSVNRGSGCTNTGAGHGCILSYNISNPSSVSQAGSGLNVTTPGTPGCWATGGILPDNSATATGASQIYFVNLNGATAGGAGGGTPTSTNCAAGAGPTIDATQASQSSP